MPLLGSNSAIRMGLGLFNATVGRVSGKAYKLDWVSNKIMPKIAEHTGAPITKKLYRGVSEEEAKLYQQGKIPKGNLTYWSDGMDTAHQFAGKNGRNGYVVEANVNLDPSKRDLFVRNDMRSEESFRNISKRYPNAYGETQSHRLNNSETWYSVKDKYLNQNGSGFKVTKL